MPPNLSFFVSLSQSWYLPTILLPQHPALSAQCATKSTTQLFTHLWSQTTWDPTHKETKNLACYTHGKHHLSCLFGSWCQYPMSVQQAQVDTLGRLSDILYQSTYTLLWPQVLLWFRVQSPTYILVVSKRTAETRTTLTNVYYSATDRPLTYSMWMQMLLAAVKSMR